MFHDSANGVIYWGNDGDQIYWCDTSTGCDESGDFASVGDIDTDGGEPRGLIYDPVNKAMLAVDYLHGKLIRCATSNGCESTGDWSTIWDKTDFIYDLAYDPNEEMIYLTTNNDVFVCDTADGCDSSGDFATYSAATSGTTWIRGMTETGSLYGGMNTNAKLNSATIVPVTYQVIYSIIKTVVVDPVHGTEHGKVVITTKSDGTDKEPLSIDDAAVIAKTGSIGLKVTGSGVLITGSGDVEMTSSTAAFDINSDTMRLRLSKTPSSATDSCNQGDIAFDSDYMFRCVATDTWKRAALSTW